MKKIDEEKDYSIIVQDVTKKYENIIAVSNVSFCAKKGEIIALLGPNGAGKSTLMNMLAGFLAPTSGTIVVSGKNMLTDDLVAKKDIGYLPEGAPMYADMTVKLFLQYIIELKLNLQESENLTKQQIKKTYEEELLKIAQTAKIENVLDQKIETLSKGYTRRTDFAQSIIGNPSVILLDEPTDGLDPNQKEHMRQLIKNMGKNKTILISTHLLEEAETIASRILLIHNGKIATDGTLKEILTKTKQKDLASAFKKITK